MNSPISGFVGSDLKPVSMGDVGLLADDGMDVHLSADDTEGDNR